MEVEKKNVYQRLLDVMQEVSYIQKEDRMVNGQYRFVSHDAVTSATRGAFIKHRVLPIPTILSRSVSGNLTTVDLLVQFVNVDEPSDKIIVRMDGYGIDSQDKGVGKAVSYAYKYALLKALNLETGDDPERDNINRDEKKNHTEGAQEVDDIPEEPKKQKVDAKSNAQHDAAIADIKARLDKARSVEEYRDLWNHVSATRKAKLITPAEAADYITVIEATVKTIQGVGSESAQ